MPTREQLLTRARELAKSAASEDEYVPKATSLLTLVEILRGRDHGHAKTLRQAMEVYVSGKVDNSYALGRAVEGIAKGLLSDLEAGLIPDLESRIRVEVEGDFLAQAHRLLEEDRLKDPAAMLIGAVLEDGLRQLCRKHGMAEANNIETMNEALRQGGAYALPQKQQVTAWGAIRNRAAHGRFNEYDAADVRRMHEGVAGFLAKYLGDS